jgi:hypothetical protein
VTIFGRGAEVGIFKHAGVNIPVGYRSSYAAQAHVDAHHTVEVGLELLHYCAGACSPVVAGESKYPTVGAVQNDGIGDAEGTSVSGAVSAGSGTTRGMGDGASATSDHDWTIREGGTGAAGVDDPHFAELITYEKVASGRIVNRPIGHRQCRLPAKQRSNPVRDCC